MVCATTGALAVVAAGSLASRVALVARVVATHKRSIFHGPVTVRAKSHLNIASVLRRFSATAPHYPDSRHNPFSVGVQSHRDTGTSMHQWIINPAASLASLAVVNYRGYAASHISSSWCANWMSNAPNPGRSNVCIMALSSRL